ncbi:MAG: hypothetical protein NTW19_23535 [Planctomycetota bacterium]|nr:hypothetical protein [Planctomycetota bacterium]
MSKQEVIEQIRVLNRTAQPDFLIAFDQQALETYLKRLSSLKGVRGRASVWVRTGQSPASCTRNA